MPGAGQPEFDLQRLRELQNLLDADLPAIIATLLGELTRAADEVQIAIAATDWASMARAAHAGRNSALMLDAHPLLAALREVELAARATDPVAAHAAGAHLQLAWPALRTRLQAEAQRVA